MNFWRVNHSRRPCEVDRLVLAAQMKFYTSETKNVERLYGVILNQV